MENTLGVRISISTETEHLLQTVVQLVHCSVLKKKKQKKLPGSEKQVFEKV